MKIEIDDDAADLFMEQMLKEAYVKILQEIKDEAYIHPEDIETLEEVVVHFPPVMKYFMSAGAYQEFMNRVQEMKEND